MKPVDKNEKSVVYHTVKAPIGTRSHWRDRERFVSDNKESSDFVPIVIGVALLLVIVFLVVFVGR